MMRNRLPRLVAALLVGASGVALAYAAPLRTSLPTAARAYDVTAGYGDDDYAANVFNPQVIQVYVGDTVRWHIGGLLEPHDVAFGLKAALDALAATLQIVVPAKAGPPTVEINPRLVAPSVGATYDGTGVAHSGFMSKSSPDNTWSLTFTRPGTYTYYCLVHYDPTHPGQSMSGVVKVLPPPTAAHVYRVQSGYDDGTPRFAADAFVPEDLTVHVGDTVVWSPGFHTVSFGPPALLAELRRGFIAPAPRASGPPTLALNPRVIYPSGGHTYGGMGFVNSGLLIAPKPHPFALTFTAPGVYHYACLVHPGMDGIITVLPASQ